MSIQAVAWVLDHSESRGMARLVLIALANHANADGECWPAQRTIAREAGISQSHIGAHVRKLVGLGELEVLNPGNARRSARYRLLLPQRSHEDRSAQDGIAAIPLAGSEPSVNPRSPNGDPLPDVSSSLDLPLLETPHTQTGEAATAQTGQGVQELVAGYVDDYRVVCGGHDPAASFKASAGRAIRAALREGEQPAVIARCLGIIARERKNPATLVYVLADYHAKAPRRKQP